MASLPKRPLIGQITAEGRSSTAPSVLNNQGAAQRPGGQAGIGGASRAEGHGQPLEVKAEYLFTAMCPELVNTPNSR